MKKIYCSALVMVVILLSVSIGTANAAPRDFNPDNFENFERFIIEKISEKDIDSFKNMGCMLKHVIGDSASFDCPENIKSILPGTSARKARIFRIVDLGADQQTGADLVWAEGITGNGVSVAVLDTGIDTDHLELMDSYMGGYDFVNDDSVPEHDHGHGTHVAGIITSTAIVTQIGQILEILG